MKTPQLVCDQCLASGSLEPATRQANHGQTLDELRDALATVGWFSDKARDIDYCSTHVGIIEKSGQHLVSSS